MKKIQFNKVNKHQKYQSINKKIQKSNCLITPIKQRNILNYI
jgi:hypothetical protein